MTLNNDNTFVLVAADERHIGWIISCCWNIARIISDSSTLDNDNTYVLVSADERHIGWIIRVCWNITRIISDSSTLLIFVVVNLNDLLDISCQITWPYSLVIILMDQYLTYL